jgi:hypothetical protein
MNKIIDLLKQYESYFDFDQSDYDFYDNFAKIATAQEFNKKYQDFLKIFESFKTIRFNTIKKVENVNKSINRTQNKELNKQLIEKMKHYKQKDLSRTEIAKKLGIDMKKLISLENLGNIYKNNN